MSHDFASGEHFITRGQSVWHTLGDVIPQDQHLTVQDAMERTRMNWAPHVTPAASPVQAATADWSGVTTYDEIPGIDVWRPVNLDGDVRMIHMGGHGVKYDPLPNAVLFQHVQGMMDKFDDLRIECCGQLGNGKVPFMLISSGTGLVTEGDEVRNYLLVLSSHDASYSTSAFPTQVRVCCANTIAMAVMGARGRIKVKHTRQQEGGLEMLFQSMEYGQGVFRQNMAKFQAMAEARVTDDQAEAYLRSVFDLPKDKTDENTRSSNKLDALMATWEANAETSDGYGKGAEVYGGDKNAWRLFNVATEFQTHHDRRTVDSSAKYALTAAGQKENAYALDAAIAYTSRVAADGTDASRLDVHGMS